MNGEDFVPFMCLLVSVLRTVTSGKSQLFDLGVICKVVIARI